MMKKVNYQVSINSKDFYLNRSQMEQFKLECPACGVTVNLLEFEEHLRKDFDEIKGMYYPNQTRELLQIKHPVL